MKVILNILGGLFLLAGICWIIFVVVAVANHNPDYSTFTKLIPVLAFHALCDLVGIILIGLALRLKKPVTAG